MKFFDALEWSSGGDFRGYFRLVLTYHTASRLVRRLFSLEHKTAEEMRGRVAINLLRGFCFRDFEQSHPSCFTPGEVESLRCEITVRCVGAGVCGFDADVQ
jgi:hypothetical protein